jgi:hypothetical protein
MSYVQPFIVNNLHTGKQLIRSPVVEDDEGAQHGVEDIEQRMENVDICLCLLVPITIYKFDIDTTPVYLVQDNSQQDGNSDDGDTGQQELLATEQGATQDIERMEVEHER